MDFAFLIAWSLCRKSDAGIERGFKARASDSSGIKCAFSVAISHRPRATRAHSKENQEEGTTGGERELEQSRLCQVALALATRNTSTCINREEKTRTRVLPPRDLSHPSPMILSSNSPVGGRYAGDMTIIKVADNPRRSPTCLSVKYATILSPL